MYASGLEAWSQAKPRAEPASEGACWSLILNTLQPLIPPELQPALVLHLATRDYSARLEATRQVALQSFPGLFSLPAPPAAAHSTPPLTDASNTQTTTHASVGTCCYALVDGRAVVSPADVASTMHAPPDTADSYYATAAPGDLVAQLPHDHVLAAATTEVLLPHAPS